MDDAKFGWSKTEIKQSISEHPLASRMPRAAQHHSGALFFDGGNDFFPLIESKDMPRKIVDWTTTDAPLLSFHIVSFTDATLVTVSWCHAFADGVGIASLMKAWTAVLAGREHDVPPLLNLKRDPVELLHSKSQALPEEYALYPWMLKGASFLKFVAGQIWEGLWYPKTETRMLCLPKDFVSKLRELAVADLAKIGEAKRPFVSEGDAISAWLTRLTVSALQIPSSQPVALANVLDTRPLIANDDVLPEGNEYFGNMCIQFFTYPSAGALANETLGATALRVRRALEEQRTPEQFEAYIAAHKEATAAGRLTLFGPWNMVMMSVSNWHKARFFEYDFSPAIVCRPKGEEMGGSKSPAGRPSYINVAGHENIPISSRNVGCLVGRDACGNWWMNWTMRKQAWPEFTRMAVGSSSQAKN